jgi:hypothetical protein
LLPSLYSWASPRWCYISWRCKCARMDDLSRMPKMRVFRCSPHWRITKRDLDPKMEPVSYGLWQRCEYTNMTIVKQGVALGVRPHVQTCRPNVYLRYSPDKFRECYNIRRNCPVIQKEQIPQGCACRYLRSDRALQWLTVLAAVCIVLGLLFLHLKTIAQPQNGLFASIDGRTFR